MKPASEFSERAAVPSAPDGASAVGHVTFIFGCMFSGKTTELLRRVRERPADEVLAVKHACDIRYTRSQIVSHDGLAVEAVVVGRAREIPERLQPATTLLAVDEAHFFDEELVDVVLQATARGIDVVLTGLDPDSWGRPFPVCESLMAIARTSIARHARCGRCGREADRTQRLTHVVGGDMLVGPEHYEPRCRECWRPPILATSPGRRS